jgi:hypothetical protein
MPNFAAFVSYVLITTFTPGPNNIMSMSNASRYGFKRSIMFNVGVFLGFFLIMALSALFSVALYGLIPSIKPVMTSIGAAYIMWLAWKTYSSNPQVEERGHKAYKHPFGRAAASVCKPEGDTVRDYPCFDLYCTLLQICAGAGGLRRLSCFYRLCIHLLLGASWFGVPKVPSPITAEL